MYDFYDFVAVYQPYINAAPRLFTISEETKSAELYQKPTHRYLDDPETAYELEVCGYTRTRGFTRTRPVPADRVRVG